MFVAVHYLKYTWYKGRFKNYLYFRLQVTGCQCAHRFTNF
jgi:hypothetical protein